MRSRMSTPAPAAILEYLDSRPHLARGLEWVRGRRYRLARLSEPGASLVVIAHGWRDTRAARRVALALEEDWPGVPESCRESYAEILAGAPELVVLDLRR